MSDQQPQASPTAGAAAPDTAPSSTLGVMAQTLIPMLGMGLGGALAAPAGSSRGQAIGAGLMGGAQGFGQAQDARVKDRAVSAQEASARDRHLYYQDRVHMSQLAQAEAAKQAQYAETYVNSLPEDRRDAARIDIKKSADMGIDQQARIDRNHNLADMTKGMNIDPTILNALSTLDDKSYNTTYGHIIAGRAAQDNIEGSAYAKGYAGASGRLAAQRQGDAETAKGLRFAAGRLAESEPDRAKMLTDKADELEAGLTGGIRAPAAKTDKSPVNKLANEAAAAVSKGVDLGTLSQAHQDAYNKAFGKVADEKPLTKPQKAALHSKITTDWDNGAKLLPEWQNRSVDEYARYKTGYGIKELDPSGGKQTAAKPSDADPLGIR